MPLPVPFGFGVGDILAVGTLVWKVYSAYAGAPEQFRNFAREILSLHTVIRKVEEQLGISGPDSDVVGASSEAGPSSNGGGGGAGRLRAGGSGSIASLTTKDTNDLRILYDALQTIMQELDDLLKKYQSLASNPTISFDRLRWGQQDLAGLRDRVHMNMSFLTGFNASLVHCQVAKQSAQQNAQLLEIQQQLGLLLTTSGLRRKGSVASLHSIASFALSNDQKEAWKEFCRELHRNGVMAEALMANKEEILKLCQAGSTVTDNQIPGLEAQQHDNRARKKDWASLDNVARMLSLPAVRTRYLVAELGVKRLLGNDDSIDATNAAGETELHIAAAKGRTDLVRLLLDRGATVDASDKYNHQTALHRAAHNGHVEVVQVLLDRGATIDARDNNLTALHRAADRGHIGVVKVLLDKGATVDALDSKSGTPLHRAADRGHIEVMNVLLDSGANIEATIDGDYTALHWAAMEGNIKVVKVLLDRGASIDTRGNGKWTAFHWAADRGHVDVVKLLLDRGARIDATTYRNWNSLHGAAMRGRANVVEVLLEYGANIDCKTSEGETALDIARRLGWESGVELLKAKGARNAESVP